jgi:DNA methylase-type I restriction-modification system
LQVLFRTKLYKDWLLKYNVGTSYPVIKDENILNIPIPVLEDHIHERIREFVTDSQNAFNRATSLLECAKFSVEMAIETDEVTAIKWLESKIEELAKE